MAFLDKAQVVKEGTKKGAACQVSELQEGRTRRDRNRKSHVCSARFLLEVEGY